MGGCNSWARTPIFCLNFFWRIFKMTKIFAIFRFFYCMISLHNRRFLAYMPKKISPEKSSSGTSIRLLYSELSKYCIVLYIQILYLKRNRNCVSSCREFDVIGVKSEGRGSKTCERFVTQFTTRERFGIRRRHARKLLFSSLNFSQSSRMYTVVGLSTTLITRL